MTAEHVKMLPDSAAIGVRCSRLEPGVPSQFDLLQQPFSFLSVVEASILVDQACGEAKRSRDIFLGPAKTELSD